MISNISIKNYKAFEYANIPIKPITIFLGANSVGKSSIIQLLLLLQQTSKEDYKSYKSALKLYGGYVNLGDPINLFRKKNATNPIELTFNLNSKNLSSLLKTQIKDNFIENITSIPKYIPIRSFLEIRKTKIVNREDYEKYIKVFSEILSKEHSSREYISEIKWFLKNRINMNIDDVQSFNIANLLRIYDLLESISKSITNESFEFKFIIELKRNKLNVTDFKLSHTNKIIVHYSSKNEIVVKSDFINFNNNEIIEIESLFDNNNTIFNSFSKRVNDDNLSTITLQIRDIIVNALNDLKVEFSENSINYVSPLRAHPKRYYMLDKAKVNYTLDTLDGDAIADVLKENSNIKKKVNEWLNKFNLSVNVEEFKEVVHHLKVKQNELNLDITDVGFGISQILPVIIQGFLSSNGSTTIIEQPEIHLHPKMQADLADLFIDIVINSKGKKLIIETHSEYLLKRLRRRISEGKISANDVSICLFYPQVEEMSGYIQNIVIEDKGFFEWPKDFYGGELFKDTTEFLINQSK